MTDDDLPDEAEDKTLLRPRPGGRRGAPQPGAPQPPGQQVPPQQPPQQPPGQQVPPQPPPGQQMPPQQPPGQQVPPQQPPGQQIPPQQPVSPQPPVAQQAAPSAQASVPSLDSIRGAGTSPLAQAASPLLVLMSQLRGLPAHADVNALHQQVIGRVQKFEADAIAAGVAPQIVASARYALCTALDETVLSTPWGTESIWSTHSLLTTFHQETWGGEKFFQILDRLKGNVAGNLDLLEVLYFCLALGFEGKYKILERGNVQIAGVRDELYRLIRQYRGDFERRLSPRWEGVVDRRNPLTRYVPLWVVASVLITVLLALFVSFRFTLSRSAVPIDAALSGVGVQDLSVAAPVVPAIRLRPKLADLEGQGLIRVIEDGGVTTITIPGDDLFASGSAEVNDRYEAILLQIGDAIETTPGTVRVIGHTDNVPIRSFRFQSNWELSRERAIDVAEIVGERMTATSRLIPQGVADTLPAPPFDDTPEGRAADRRVEIVHVAQAAAQ